MDFLKDWKQDNWSFIYALNRKGTNRFWFNIYQGNDDNGDLTSRDEVNSIAKVIINSPKMIEALMILPIDEFIDGNGEYKDNIDAADFVDHSNDFMMAMKKAQEILVELGLK